MNTIRPPSSSLSATQSTGGNVELYFCFTTYHQTSPVFYFVVWDCCIKLDICRSLVRFDQFVPVHIEYHTNGAK